MVAKNETIFKQNSQEIKYHIINSLLAGSLVFFGSLVNGFSFQGVIYGFIASTIIAVNKFKDYWKTQEGEYKRNYRLKYFSFI